MVKKDIKKIIPLLMLTFTIAGIIGFIYEEICVYINDGVLNWGNLNGYICARSVITWGLFGLLLISGILPLTEKFRDKHPRAFNTVAVPAFSLFALDIVLSLAIK